MRRGALLAMALVAAAAACTHGAPPAGTGPGPAGTPAPVEKAAPAPPLVDLASPITAAGVETPEGLDWGAKGDDPASSMGFKNLEIFGDVSANRMMAAMQSMESNLGRKCDACHDPDDWGSDTKKQKIVAREMIGMNFAIDRDWFAGTTRVTCYTCHRGLARPQRIDPQLVAAVPMSQMPPLAPADADRPASEVYKNIQVIKGPASGVAVYMAFMSASLSVQCTHCHIDGYWDADDKPEKQRTREMIRMTDQLIADYPERRIGCFLCHQGSTVPARTARTP